MTFEKIVEFFIPILIILSLALLIQAEWIKMMDGDSGELAGKV